MFYNKCENTHISDNLELIPADTIKENDNILIVAGKENVYTSFLTLKKIEGEVYSFAEHKNHFKLNELEYLPNYKQTAEEITHAFLYNNHLINIGSRHSYSHDIPEKLMSIVYNYHKKGQNKMSFGTFKQKVDPSRSSFNYNREDNKVDSLCFYLIIPLANNSVVVLNVHNVNNKKRYRLNTTDDLIIIKFKDAIDKEFESKFMKLNQEWLFSKYAFESTNAYTGNITSVFKKIMLYTDNFNNDAEIFKELLNAVHYRMSIYLTDDDRETNIDHFDTIIKKYIYSDYNIKQLYAPVFTYPGKQNIKSYFFESSVYVTIDDQLIDCGSGSSKNNFCNDTFESGGIIYTKTIPDIIKNDKKLQTLYKIAYDMANFELERRNGVNPKDGHVYHNGEINDSTICYRDDEGIILKERNNEQYYVKKYGYFISSYNGDDVKELKERYQMIEKLKKV